MNNLAEVASVLRERVAAVGLTQLALSAAAGITRRTLTLALSGTHDFKLTTLMAVADRLGLELVLLPKGAAAALHGAGAEPGQVKSLIELGQERLVSTPAKGQR